MQLILILHNLRSTHNVGSILRTAEGLGVDDVIFSGYTPYPIAPNDQRLPHLAAKLERQINKTALGAQKTQPWQVTDNLFDLLPTLRSQGYHIYGLELTPDSIDLKSFKAPAKLALILGREVEGLEANVIKTCDGCIQIPMQGQKESFNVAVAAAIASYALLNIS